MDVYLFADLRFDVTDNILRAIKAKFATKTREFGKQFECIIV